MHMITTMIILEPKSSNLGIEFNGSMWKQAGWISTQF